MDTGLTQKIAVLCKDYYTISRITDLFIFGGAGPHWWVDPTRGSGSERMHHVFGWLEGIERNAPDQLNAIIEGVVIQLLENESIPQSDRNFLRRKLEMPERQSKAAEPAAGEGRLPKDVEKLLEILIQGVRRAMFPLAHRRKDFPRIAFENEYDVQDLLHALLRPWIGDIRTEEYTPSYAGSSARVDFLLPKYAIVLEVKFVRDQAHAKVVGNELILDVAHYGTHPDCEQLWCVVYDPAGHLANAEGLKTDLEKEHSSGDQKVKVRVFTLAA